MIVGGLHSLATALHDAAVAMELLNRNKERANTAQGGPKVIDPILLNKIEAALWGRAVGMPVGYAKAIVDEIKRENFPDKTPEQLAAWRAEQERILAADKLYADLVKRQKVTNIDAQFGSLPTN
jgi:hypothetical protein